MTGGGKSAAAFAEEHYARIAAEDGPDGKGINSYLALSKERALAQAARVDKAVARGEALGPLAGVPVGIKDVLTMEGSPATAGSKILNGYMPPYDATVVKRLEAAGAVLLGKLNCDEFAMGKLEFENSAYGLVRNPRGAGPGAGWFERRQRGGGGGEVRGRVVGHGYGWIDSSAGGVLRCCWIVADFMVG